MLGLHEEHELLGGMAKDQPGPQEPHSNPSQAPLKLQAHKRSEPQRHRVPKDDQANENEGQSDLNTGG